MSRRVLKLSADVAALVGSYRPVGLTDHEAAVLPVVMPLVRASVAAAVPAALSTARTLLWATTRLALWAYLTLGSVDPAVVLHPHNVHHFTEKGCGDQPETWRHAVRSALCRVGRAANPNGWDPLLPEFGRTGAPAPYSYGAEAGFGLAAVMPGRRHRAARMWVMAGSCGAGLLGTQLRSVGPPRPPMNSSATHQQRKRLPQTPSRNPLGHLARRSCIASGSGSVS